MSVTVYKKTALTGGAASALDSVDGAGLLKDDMAFVTVSNYLYTYILDDANSSAESSPSIISPDTNAGTKRWVLLGLDVANMKSVSTAISAAELAFLAGITGGILTGASGTKGIFYQDTAPSGWTIQNTLDDKLLFITKGSAAGGQTGGGAHSGGTWTQPNHNHTGPSHTHTTGDVTLSAAQSGLPAHGHLLTVNTGAGAAGDAVEVSYSPYTTNSSAFVVSSSGAAAASAHNHGSTGSSGTGNTGDSATANTWRPAAYCAIICSKN